MAKTREQRRKRERAKTAIAALVLMLLWMGLCTMMVKAWLDEPVISGYEYMEQIGGEF